MYTNLCESDDWTGDHWSQPLRTNVREILTSQQNAPGQTHTHDAWHVELISIGKILRHVRPVLDQKSCVVWAVALFADVAGLDGCVAGRMISGRDDSDKWTMCHSLFSFLSPRGNTLWQHARVHCVRSVIHLCVIQLVLQYVIHPEVCHLLEGHPCMPQHMWLRIFFVGGEIVKHVHLQVCTYACVPFC